jgi:hypothetical protein
LKLDSGLGYLYKSCRNAFDDAALFLFCTSLVSQQASDKASNCDKESWDQQNMWQYLNGILEWWINENLGS